MCERKTIKEDELDIVFAKAADLVIDRIYIGLHFRKCVGYAVRVRLTVWIVKTIAGMAPNLNSACVMCVYA